MLTKEQVEKIYQLSDQYEDGVNVQKGESELEYILRNMKKPPQETILYKALELACGEITNALDILRQYDGNYYLEDSVDYWITQAKYKLIMEYKNGNDTI